MADKKATKENKVEAETPVEAPVEAPVETPAETAEPEKFAKSGKKSKKHTEEVKAEEERQARKAERKAADAAVKPKGATPVTRPKLERRGKKYQESAKLIEKGKNYNLKEAIELAIKANPAKFDASLEIHARLGVDPRQADQTSVLQLCCQTVAVKPSKSPSLHH